MTRVYEIDTWRGRDDLNRIAIAEAKKYSGKKYTVAIGEWGTKTYLVLAESKEEARKLALAEYDGTAHADNKIKVREVTNCKKYS